MKTKLSALTLLLAASLASAQTVSSLLSYQGRVTDAAGNLIGNSAPVNRAVTFRLYDAASGGSALYAETQTATISGGEFSLLIGNGTGVSGSPGPSAPASPVKKLNDIINSTAYETLYLGITVDDGVTQTVDAEISPRQQLVSGAFAFRAGIAQGVASGAVNTAMIGDSQVSTNKVAASAITTAKIADANITNAKIANSTITAAKLDSSSIGVWTPSGNNLYRSAGNVGIGQTNPGFPLNFADALGDKISLHGNSGAHYGFGIAKSLLQIHSANSSSDVAFGYGSSASFTETMRVKGDGNVGIGITNPTDKLHINGGNLRVSGTTSPGLTLLSATSGEAILAVAGAPGAWSSSAATADLVLRSKIGKLHLQSGTAAAGITIDTNNKVGIGTLSPTGMLAVKEASGTVAAPTKGTVVLEHGNSGGASSLVFPSAKNRGSDYGYIQYQDAASLGGGGESARLIIGTQNDGDDDIQLMPSGRVGVKTTNTSQGNLNVQGGIVSIGSRNGTPGYARIVYENQGRIVFEGYNTNINNGQWRGFSMDGNNDIDWRSDRRLKKDIVDAEPMLDRLMQLPFRRYHWKDTTDVNPIKEFGVIAQEVEPLFPDLIGRGEDGIMTVGYTSFATIACKALQELKVETDASRDELTEKLSEKDAEIAALEARLSALEKLISSAK